MSDNIPMNCYVVLEDMELTEEQMKQIKFYQNSRYYNREYSTEPIIHKQKYQVNKFLAKRFNPKDYTLIVDGPENGSRTILLKYGYNNEKIITVNSELKFNNHLYYDTTLETFLKENLLKMNIKYSNIFADVVNNHIESIRQVKSLFESQMTTEEGIFALTCCLRGVTAIQFRRWNYMIMRMGKNLRYCFTPIIVPNKLRIPLQNNKTRYTIKSNMSDNGAYKHTGRTVTAFFRFKKL
jgi:hypothetical protein